jgi:hypothetical protein
LHLAILLIALDLEMNVDDADQISFLVQLAFKKGESVG